MESFSLSSLPSDLEYVNGRTSPNKDEVFIALSDLEKPMSNVENDIFNSVLILEVVYHKKAKAKNPQSFFSCTKANLSISFERMVVLRCLNSPRGINMCTILIGKNRNANLWDQHIEVNAS